MVRPRKFPLVIVEWEDITSKDGWHEWPKEALTPLIFTSAGFLIHNNAAGITIVNHVMTGGQEDGRRRDVGDTHYIPHGAILKMRKVKGVGING